MSGQSYSKITLCVILLFLFPSCGYFYNASSWIEETSSPNPSRYWSTRLHHPSNSLGIEIIRDSHDTRVYLNLMICPVKPDNPENRMISFEYSIGSVKYTGSAYVLKGGQRLLLDDYTSTVMLDALKSGQELTISVGMYDSKFIL